MSTSAIINIRNIDVNNINFVVGQAKNGRNPSISIKYSGQNLQLRLPRMKLPGGISIRESEQNDNKSYSLMGSLTGADPYGKERAAGSDDLAKLYNFMLDLEEKIIASAFENSVKWFGKKRSEEAIRDSFKKLLRLSVDKIDGEYVTNGKYPPSVIVKVPVYDNRVSTEVVDNRGNPMYMTPSSLPSVFPKGVEANLVVSGSIYNVNGSFGVTWRLTYAQVFPQQKMTAANVFADDIEDEDQPLIESPIAPPEPVLSSDETAVNIEVVDPDDSPAPEPAPAPAPSTTARKSKRTSVPY